MNRSLQRRLSLTLSGALLLAALLAAAVSFWLAYDEAAEAQDDVLRQVAAVDAAAQTATADPDARLIVLHLPRDSRPGWLPAALAPGMHTLTTPTGPVRACVVARAAGQHTVVAQSTAITNELATDSALRILLPLLLLIPVQAFLIVRLVRTGLAPIHSLARQLDNRAAGQAGALPTDGIPAEITPFVDAMNDLLQRQRRFIADAAHELRTPLTALHLQAQNLDGAASIESMRARLQPLQEGVARARRLTEQMLDLASVAAGAQPPAVVDLQDVARELVALFLPLCLKHRIDIGFGRSTPVKVIGSADHVRQVLRNALDNAIRYTPPDGQVTLDIYCDAGCAVVDVTDDGPGIPAAERARVFDPFVRLPGAVGVGSGIGLAIAREAARGLGGNVTLHDRTRGTGLVFRYTQRHHIDGTSSHAIP